MAGASSALLSKEKDMFVYALKFREKGEKKYKTVFIQAKDINEMDVKFEKFLEEDFYDVDRRTISWAGGSIPFMSYNGVEVIDANLDEIN